MRSLIEFAWRFEDALLKICVLNCYEAAPLLLVRKLVVMAIASPQVLAGRFFAPFDGRVAIVNTDATSRL